MGLSLRKSHGVEYRPGIPYQISKERLGRAPARPRTAPLIPRQIISIELNQQAPTASWRPLGERK